MEPLSQALLGAATADIVAGRRLGRRALLWGALVGMAPDLDVLAAPLHAGFGEWLYHRGTTHALWFGPVVGPLQQAPLGLNILQTRGKFGFVRIQFWFLR